MGYTEDGNPAWVHYQSIEHRFPSPSFESPVRWQISSADRGDPPPEWGLGAWSAVDGRLGARAGVLDVMSREVVPPRGGELG